MALKRLLAASLTAAACAAGIARADGPAAETLFREGREAAHRGDFTTACARFSESYRQVATVGTLLNLGDCEQHLGHDAAALARFRRALAELPAGDERVEIARSAIVDLATKVPHVTIMLAPGPEPATRITLDGAPFDASQLGSAVEVDPGRHVVVAGRAGHADRKYVLELAESQSRGVVVEAGSSLATGASPPPAPVPATAAGAEPREAPRAASSSTRRTAGFVLGGVGVAGVAVGSVFGALAIHDKSTRDAHCTAPGNTCDPTGADAVHDGSRDATISTVAFAVGAAALGTGAYLVLTSRRPSSVGVTATPGGASVAFGGSF